MTQADPKVRAQALARDLDLSAEGRALLRNDQSPGQFLAALTSRHLYVDAIQLLSRWLPTREAVWWACQCIWHVHRSGLPRVEEDALRAALKWVVDPGENHRRVAQEAGEAAGMSTPAGCIAHAVFWSGGSISLPNLPVVQPPPGAAATTLARALILATASLPESEQHRQRFVHLGHQIALGGNHWEPHVKELSSPLPRATRDQKEKLR